MKEELSNYVYDYIEMYEDEIDAEDLDSAVDIICEDFAQENGYSYTEVYKFRETVLSILEKQFGTGLEESKKIKVEAKTNWKNM